VKINRIRNPATIVPGAQWYNTIDSLRAAMPPEPTPEPSPQLELLPLPPIDSEEEAKWKRAVEISGEVLDELQKDGETVDHNALLQVVRDLTGGMLTVADVAALYRLRMEKHG